MYKQDSIRLLFPEHMKHYFENVISEYEQINEVRVRRNGPIQVRKQNQGLYLTAAGTYTAVSAKGVCLSGQEFADLFSHICRHSVYAFEQEIVKGYLTVEGGHRIGIVGQTVWDGREIKAIKYISAINIRIAHEIKGVADPVLPYLYENGALKSTLLVSLPGCGKTTLLRDLVRKISNGNRNCLPRSVSLIDERSEIASCYLGIAQNDVGIHTDILDACPKAVGMEMVLRSMSPHVIAVDELGGEADYTAMQQAFYLGCKILATIHGTDYEMLNANPNMHTLLEKRCFERIVFLQGRVGERQEIVICNEKGERLN